MRISIICKVAISYFLIIKNNFKPISDKKIDWHSPASLANSLQYRTNNHIFSRKIDLNIKINTEKSTKMCSFIEF